MEKNILNILKKHGYNTPESIVRASNKELLNIKGIGKRGVQIIRQEYGPPLIGWPVEEQCKFLGIPFQKIKAKWDAHNFHRFNWFSETQNRWVYPEDWVLDYYTEDGWEGVNSEEQFILTLFRLLSEPELSKHSYWSLSFMYITAFFSGANKDQPLSPKSINTLVSNLLNSTELDLIKRFEFCKNPKNWAIMNGYYHTEHWPTDLIVKAYRAFGKDKLAEIFKLLLNDGAKFRFGWPDLILFKDGKIKFIEVKTIDLLGQSQIDLWDNVLNPVGLDVSVVQLKPKLLIDKGS